MRLYQFLFLLVPVACSSVAIAQSTSASITGLVDDPSKALIPAVTITAINTQTGEKSSTTTNKEGQYVLPGLNPGTYRIEVDKPGFKGIIEAGLTLHVQDAVQINFHMAVGSSSESVTVTADQNNINTTDATVATVIDHQFIENMPLNGRSLQDLLTLAPGVSVVPGGSLGSSGEFTVNGERTEENYFTVDGVSANTGMSLGGGVGGAGYSGGVPGETVLGTTQSLVSLDALQEFRATTSTYSAEYGRTPGGQFSLSTRSGSNAWNGSAFEYFRNTVFDANNWFNTYSNPPTPRLPEHQNDFGGTIGGPLVIPGLYNGRDKTFFFFSFEGLRLLEPQGNQVSSVPDMALRQEAPAVLSQYLTQWPLPNGGEDGLNDNLGIFNLAYSAPSSLQNVGIRVDHTFTDKLKIFARYSNTPSSGWSYGTPAYKDTNIVNIQGMTIGATSSLSSSQTNELRFNMTQNDGNTLGESSNLDGATSFNFAEILGPNGQPANLNNTFLFFGLNFGAGPGFDLGNNYNSQRLYNITDSHTWLKARHNFKFGVDWRRITTNVVGPLVDQFLQFNSVASVLSGVADEVDLSNLDDGKIEPEYNNFSLYAQDEWKASSRMSLSLGLRWDANPPPGNVRGLSPYTANQITNLETLAAAPANTPLWKTDLHAFAPRLGLAYQIHQKPSHETVLRAGFGVFYDTGNTTASNGFQCGLGFCSSVSYYGVALPLTQAQTNLPPPSVAAPYNDAFLFAFDPNVKPPYSMQWNVALEQEFGAGQSLTLNYVGSGGRKLLATYYYYPYQLGNPNFGSASELAITANRASSDYSALQVKFDRKLSHGAQALASYTFSHSIDDATSNFQLEDLLLHASSDFDIRHNFQAAITYSIPGNYSNHFVAGVLKNWGVDTRVSARSAVPVDILAQQYVFNPASSLEQNFHPNLVPGQPIYLYGPQYPGKRIINYDAFTPTPSEIEGNTPRNFVRGYDAVQANLALRRNFAIRERLQLQFRTEAFNVFNHPNFGGIYNNLQNGPSQFGYANSTLNDSLGDLSPLYQTGGPRSLQLMLKLKF